MKEIFMEQIQEQYGSYDKYIEEENKNAARQWVHLDEHPCPNCNNVSLHQDEGLDINCDVCGQNFIQVDNALRFK